MFIPKLIVLSILADAFIIASSFGPITSSSQIRKLTNDKQFTLFMTGKENDDCHHSDIFTKSSRRRLLSALCSISFLTSSTPVSAKDELFKPNPLTNPVLEQLRIWEQAEADNIKYGGELAPGSPKGRDAYAKLLIPILSIQKDIDVVYDKLHAPNGPNLKDANEILSKPQFQKLTFKKIFNAFADNIYYSDPDRANAYLGGGATPKNEQSIAYLLRNDVLTNLENLQAEVAYLLKEQEKGNELETEDLFQFVKISQDGMVKYLDLVPPEELKLGRDLFSKV